MKKLFEYIYLWYVEILPTCDCVIHAIDKKRHHRLTLIERFKVWIHKFTCIWCTRYEKQMNLLNRAFDKLSSHLEKEPAPNQQLNDRFKEELKNKIKENLN